VAQNKNMSQKENGHQRFTKPIIVTFAFKAKPLQHIAPIQAQLCYYSSFKLTVEFTPLSLTKKWARKQRKNVAHLLGHRGTLLKQRNPEE